MSIPMVLHTGSIDGFTAAWIIHRAMRGAQMLSIRKQEPLPPFDDRDILAFSLPYSASEYSEIAAYAHSLNVFGHSPEDLAKFRGQPWYRHGEQDCAATMAIKHMERHGYWLGMPATEQQEARKLATYVHDNVRKVGAQPYSNRVWEIMKQYPRTRRDWDEIAKALNRGDLFH